MNKKRYIVLTCVIVLVIVGITMFHVHKRTRSPLEPIQIPASKPHQHISPDGKVVQHTHRYEQPPAQAAGVPETETPDTDYMKMSRIQRAWAQLDLAEIREKWQPYTIPEMREKWFYKAMVRGMGPHFSYEEAWANIESDPAKRPDAWIQRYLDLGYPFHYHFHYRQALQHRANLANNQERAARSPKDRERVFGGVGLPPEATWEEYEDTYIKRKVLSHHAFDQQVRDDPTAAGGVYWVDSGVIPFKSDTAYVHIADDGPVSTVIGPKLTSKQEDDLRMFGIAPEGMKVVYTDKSGVPLPADMKPRFYERAMAQLKAAEQQVLQQIADHDALFNGTDAATGQKTRPETDRETQHIHTRPEEDKAPTHTVRGPQPPRKRPPLLDKNGRPTRLPEPQDPAQIEKWFEELILLHGGDLPKDLKALQKITQELKAIRREGEQKIPPKPPQPTAPETPAEE